MKIISNKNKRLRNLKRIRTVIIIFILCFLYIIAFTTTDFSYKGSSLGFFAMFKRLFIDSVMNPEIVRDIPLYVGYMFETIAIAYAGSIIGAILALPIGFLAARNMAKKFAYIGKAISNAIRSIPELIFAIIFVAAVGIGPSAGVLAISINSIGMLSKLYSEAVEAIDLSVLEALKSSGAGRIQTIWYGVIPQVIPEFLSYAIYRFEIDVRASTVLGIVGAGGIGAPIILAANSRSWEAVGMMIIVIIVFVTIIDYMSTAIRRRIV